MNGIKNIRIKSEKEEHDFIFICGILAVFFLILLAMPSFFLLSNENITAEKPDGPPLFRPSSENMTAKKFSKYSAALSLAEVGIERAVWELNHGDISSWQGNSLVRTMTISSFQNPSGIVIGKVEVRIEKPDGDNPIVESTGRVFYTDYLLGAKKSRVMLQKQARIVLEKNGHHEYQPMESN